MRDVLLLNASEEILRTIDWRHAIRLLMLDKARQPSNFDDNYEIRTSNGVYRLPTAVILKNYVYIPYKHAPLSTRNLLIRDKFICQYCGKNLSRHNGTMDHIEPQSRGGEHNWCNVVASCKVCNNRKNDMDLKDFEKKYGRGLRSEPSPPDKSIYFHDMKLRESWNRWGR